MARSRPPATGGSALEPRPDGRGRRAQGATRSRTEPARRRRLGAAVEAAAALLVSAAVLYASAYGAGPLPALGPAFNPARGVWTSAADAVAPHSQTLRLAGLNKPVTVTFEADGVPHIVAQDDLDLFRALGYLHARYRLFQMDLLRREGSGGLSEVLGKDALDTDRFQLQLGLLRTARLEWSQADPQTRQVLQAYTAGVNQRLGEEVSTGQLPMLFRLLGYQPRPWSPVDTLLVKGIMTEDLDFQDTPLTYQLMVKALGYERTMDWFPVLPRDEQHPYDAGPYQPHQPAPLPSQRLSVGAAAERATAALLNRLESLPAGIVAHGGNSNNWVVDGTKTASGKPLLAGDPHLSLTLPAIWYQVAAQSPSFDFEGVGIPGTPGIIIGRNRHIAWSLTNTQNQATIYYEEKTDAAHPGQYFWSGSWRKFETVHYDIPVKGGAIQPLDVRVSVHGPVLTQQGLTYSVYWLGNLPSPDLAVLRKVSQASNFTEFRDALRDWHAPSQNFVYGDDQGNIGLVSAGWYPIVAKGDEWLPLPGTGEYDVSGSVPFDNVPQVYNPDTHFAFSANQREVGPDYPYYIGTSIADFDPGYRADEIYRVLSTGTKLTAADMKALQNDTRDYLASKLVPKLLDALPASLPAAAQTARSLLAAWDYRMDTGSAAAAIWWTFMTDYTSETFGPWWDYYHVKAAMPLEGMAQDLEAWTLSDPGNPAFTPPNGAPRTAPEVMLAAYSRALDALTKQLGPDPARWRWGSLHARAIPSLAQIKSLGYGPFPAGGDRYTPNAAGGAVATSGPSWRMVVDFAGASYGVVPGGQSENPASAWYQDRVAVWWSGDYQPFLAAAEAPAASPATWRLTP